MAIGTPHLEKLRTLLFNSDFTVVVSGMELFDSLSLSAADCQKVFPIQKTFSTFDDFHQAIGFLYQPALSRQDTLFVALWAFAKMAEMNFSWALQIRHITVSAGGVNRLPDCFGGLSHIESLSFHRMQLEGLPPSFSKLCNLRELSFQETDLGLLPEYFGTLTELSFLNLKGCSLRYLPKSFPALTKLICLDLGAVSEFDDWATNDLQSLPDGFAALTQLEELNLQENDFSVLPTCIGQLTQLQELDLSYNHKLSILPDNFGQLRCLKVLCLQQTRLKYLPGNFSQLNLHTIEISAEQLRLPAALLAMKEQLKYVLPQLMKLPNVTADCFIVSGLSSKKVARYRRSIGTVMTEESFLCAAMSESILQEENQHHYGSIPVLFYIQSKNGKRLTPTPSILELFQVDDKQFYGIQFTNQQRERKKFYVQSMFDDVLFIPPTSFHVVDMDVKHNKRTGKIERATIYLSEL